MANVHDRVMYHDPDQGDLAAIVTGVYPYGVYLHVMPPGGTATDVLSSEGDNPGEFSPVA